MSGKKTARLGLFCAAAILLGYVESLIPPLMAIPGVKLGLPNLAIVSALYLWSWREAALISAVRIVVIALLFGNLFSFCFSLAGGIISLAVMALIKKTGRFDCAGVSLAGAVSHNLGQTAAAALLLKDLRVAYYFVPLAVAGVAAGLVIGLLGAIVIRRVARAERN